MRKLKNSKLTKILSLTLALIFILGAFTGCGGNNEEETTTEAPKTTQASKETVIRNPLTGEEGYSKKLLKNRPVFMVVENHPQARPQWGLTSSDIVWEMVAEGGITRMLLMYADASRIPEKVGPIRSARHYFVDLAEGFDGIFVHFGYSPMARAQIENHDVDNVNGLVDNYFYRDSSRNVASEHTSYTTGEAIKNAIANKEYRTEIEADYKSPFKFNNKTKTLSAPCSKITVAFSDSYTYSYKWSEKSKVYKCYLNENKFVDSDGNQQGFENVIICYTDISSIANDSKGRVDFDFSEGTGIYVSNGSYTDITWKKGESDDMLKLYNKVGDELSLNVGRTYIALMDESAEASNTIKK